MNYIVSIPENQYEQLKSAVKEINPFAPNPKPFLPEQDPQRKPDQSENLDQETRAELVLEFS